MQSHSASCSVLVVGGGIVGLTTAAFLAHAGVRVILVERRPHPSKRLRAKFFYPRTVEIYRSLGIEAEVAGTDMVAASEVALVESLAGREIRRWTLPASERGPWSPCRHSAIKQYDLELVVKARAEALGADLRFGQALVEMKVGTDAVVATVRADDGGKTTIRADYAVACDGAHSFVRHKLGIGTRGHGDLLHNMGIAVRADIRGALRGRPLAFAFVRRDDMEAFVSWDADKVGVAVSISFDPKAPGADARFDEGECQHLAATCLGLDPAAVEVVDIYGWRASSWVAERYRAGRVLLAGDAAHSVPPLGGFGANTGIHDAHNLALKLAAVVVHGGSPDLLDLYERERLPVARMVVAQATARLAARQDVRLPVEALEPCLEEEAITMGYRYAIGAAGAAPNPIALHPRLLRAEPGTRAPHVELQRAGRTISTLDLFGQGLVVLAGSGAEAWTGAAQAQLRGRDIDARFYIIGQDLTDANHAFGSAYGITDRGVVLVRSDGYVLWKAATAPDFHGDALDRVLVDAREISPPPVRTDLAADLGVGLG